jgi:hypothetical protein
MVDFNSFLKWAENTFGASNVVIRGDEININSPWAEDTKYHLACAPDGGKRSVSTGVYRCFKSQRTGTLASLIMEFDNCDYSDAVEILEGGSTLRYMEQQLEEFFSGKKKEPAKPIINPGELAIPEGCQKISDLPEEDFNRLKAVSYLESREIPHDGFYYGSSGRYKERIVIPYYDAKGRLIYYNGRYIGYDKKVGKYLGPPREVGIGKGDVLYAYEWPKIGSKIYVTEGEFDAITLNLCGFFGVACGGRYLTDTQLDMLRPYKICMAFDADKAGFEAQLGESSTGNDSVKDILKGEPLLGNYFTRRGISNLTFVRPPKDFKDWNNMMCELGEEIVQGYIKKCEQPFTDFTGSSLLSNKL